MSVPFNYITIYFFYFAASVAQGQTTFIPNHHQWETHILYQSDIPSGRAFFGENSVTYTYYCAEDLSRGHDQEEEVAEVKDSTVNEDLVRCFSFEVEFVGAQSSHVFGRDQRNYNVNYFIGNDPSRWAGNVPIYQSILYTELYPGIDVLYYGEKNRLKYDFTVSPGSDPSQINMRYKGLRSIRMEGENLILDLDFMQVKEVIPSAYQFRNGVKREVKCRFSLVNNEVHFVFPEGYDALLPLVIDPVVIASTFSGGSCLTRGYSATYDGEGNIYSGGACFGTGFPVTLGAYDVTYNMNYDIGISKYNPDGSSLLYCTYLGGTGEEYPQSMIVQQGNLYVYGSTYSFDFPVTSQAYSQTLNGICDIYVACLNNSGSTLLASTFVGGSWTDGINMILTYRCDSRRGEIVAAANGDVLIASASLSQNFPTTPGAFRTSSSGGQDAVVFRMNGALSSLIWATYIGSGVQDVAFGIREADDGSIYVCGVANNMFSPFPTVSGCYRTTPMGATEAYIAKFNSSGTALLACTFFGSSGKDVAYFIDVDKDGDVYIFGESALGAPVTPGVYAVPGSRDYIAKFNPSLTALLFSTVIGNGPASNFNIGGPISTPPSTDPHVNLSVPRGGIIPTAFGVDDCKRIYFSGFGSDQSWPLTSDALYPYSSDNQCYIGVLEENATALLSATMYAGWHVDGGMSRFDPNGILYQAVCIGGTYFPTTPSAFSDGATPPPYDVCVFKIDMRIVADLEMVPPNIFTPNNDGINDYFLPGYVSVHDYDITIYDRFGMEVFTANDPLTGWDGTHNGNDCADGVYFYTIRYRYCTESREKNGFVHLIRAR